MPSPKSIKLISATNEINSPSTLGNVSRELLSRQVWIQAWSYEIENAGCVTSRRDGITIREAEDKVLRAGHHMHCTCKARRRLNDIYKGIHDAYRQWLCRFPYAISHGGTEARVAEESQLVGVRLNNSTSV